MSDNNQATIVGKPPALDISVTEALALLAALDKLSGGGGTSPVAPRGFDYAGALQTAQPQFDAARKVVVGFPAGDSRLRRIDAALGKAAGADRDKNPKDAEKYLDRAVTNAQKLGAEVKQAFTDQKAVIEAPLAGLDVRITRLATRPPAVAQALQAATTARSNANPAADDKPEDWTASFAALATFRRAMDAIGPACLTAAQATGQGFDTRFSANKNTKPPGGKDFVDKLNVYQAARKTFQAAVTGQDGLAALEAAAATNIALTNFTNAAAPSDLVKGQRVTGAMTTLTNLKDKALADKSLLEKAEIAMDLCAGGVPTGQAEIKQLVRLYNKSKPDPQFMTKRGQERDKIADDILALPELQAVFDDKGKADGKEWKKLVADTGKMLQMLKKICDTQCDTLGMPRIVVYKNPDPPKGRTKGNLDFGGYEPSSNRIGLNLHKDCFKTIKDGLDTIIHETFHAHQDFVVKRLRSGEIGPADPDYATAMMWMVNDVGVGYLLKQVSQRDYERQPTEFDSFYNAGETVKTLLVKSKQNAK